MIMYFGSFSKLNDQPGGTNIDQGVISKLTKL